MPGGPTQFLRSGYRTFPWVFPSIAPAIKLQGYLPNGSPPSRPKQALTWLDHLLSIVLLTDVERLRHHVLPWQTFSGAHARTKSCSRSSQTETQPRQPDSLTECRLHLFSRHFSSPAQFVQASFPRFTRGLCLTIRPEEQPRALCSSNQTADVLTKMNIFDHGMSHFVQTTPTKPDMIGSTNPPAGG